ncbi:MAG: hypothetical protein K0R17_1249 [Rariglobus sp.]|jgi:hypothetical protein|nr:hypothetical protein [Rariglobus sp.]
MNHAPDAIHHAYAALVARVFLNIRNNRYTEKEELHDLGDALHNISGILGNYGAWIEDEEYRRLYIRPYDAKWSSKTLNLEQFLDESIRSYSEKKNGA